MLMSMIAALGMAEPQEIRIDGPAGPVVGTLTDPGADAPAIVWIAGSGPTDRDGNSPAGVTGGVYKQLAETLAAEGVAMLRFDKRGMFASESAIADANDVTLAGYADDARGFVEALRAAGRDCVWLAGHSEGGIVALTEAARNPDGLCGVLLVASPGRPIGPILREQLGAQLPPPMMAQAETAIASLEAGERVDVSDMAGPLKGLFNPAVQDYLIELATNDPADLARQVAVPMLIVSLDEDIQVGGADADALSAAQPGATRVDVPGVNHVFKPVEAGAGRMMNVMTYANADLAIDPAVAAAIAAFVKTQE